MFMFPIFKILMVSGTKKTKSISMHKEQIWKDKEVFNCGKNVWIYFIWGYATKIDFTPPSWNLIVINVHLKEMTHLNVIDVHLNK
jgi:hypothetical protein